MRLHFVCDLQRSAEDEVQMVEPVRAVHVGEPLGVVDHGEAGVSHLPEALAHHVYVVDVEEVQLGALEKVSINQAWRVWVGSGYSGLDWRSEQICHVYIKEYRYTKPGRAVLDQKCLYWVVWVLWVLWPLRSPKRPQICICPG